ncbi:GNAT family N-acetyltransferase [Pseudoroseicyclus sp. CXY001]|uniref:GNAT family N-acetyltransferase n=1 Tax=Pseudoroseicyclus sp. CXY001 TaxID=3242492 RepID=UPI00358DD41C
MRRLGPGDPALTEVLALIRAAFAGMEGRIDPPSSMHRLDAAALEAQAAEAEVWVIGAPVRACVILTPRASALYLGKLAVAAEARGQGLARALVQQAEARARALGLPALELQTRVELTENHATFAALGFEEVGRTSHAGFDRPTTILFRKVLA